LAGKTLVDDIASRYAPMIEQLARIYSYDEEVHAQLLSLKVTREDWDSDRRGGHFWFEGSAPRAVDDDFLVDGRAEDADGAKIEIILHPVGGILNWGEWYRLPRSPDDFEQPILRWPPPTVSPNPPSGRIS